MMSQDRFNRLAVVEKIRSAISGNDANKKSMAA